MRIALLLVILPFAAGAAAATGDYTRQDCPVIGNIQSRIYHTPASDSYRKLLKENPRGEDNRICFKNEQEARSAGYRKSRK